MDQIKNRHGGNRGGEEFSWFKKRSTKTNFITTKSFAIYAKKLLCQPKLHA